MKPSGKDTDSKPLRCLPGIVAALLLSVMVLTMAQTPPARQPRTLPRVTTPVRPTVPGADRHQPGKVFLEHADMLELDETRSSEYQTLRGNVKFRKGDMFMWCDSALFFEATGSIEAYGNVRMEQGDTLFVYGDELDFNGQDDIAHLYGVNGRKVRLINRDVVLTTDKCDYDLAQEVGYYMYGGTLADRHNTLTSMEGFYYPSTKDAYFYDDVELLGPRPNGDTLRLFTDSLTYNTNTGIARLIAQTKIVNRDGEILSRDGSYDTRNGLADLFRRSMVITRRGNTLTGDTLYFDRNTGIGRAYGSMVLTDSARQSTLKGDYGYYDDRIDSAMVTGRALALEYSQKDTLYLHGDTIKAYRLPGPDSLSVTNVYNRVRFFREDMQGLADSISFRSEDSTLYMYRHPVVWSGKRQIHGNEIRVHFNDSAVETAHLPRFGMMIEHIAEDCYNQLSGTDMTAWFNDSTVRRLRVEGNVRIVMFPMENDSSYNKFAWVESSYLDAIFANNQPERITLWPETTGTVTPLYLARRSAYFLPDFQWYDVMRPRYPEDVFIRPPEMETLMAMPDIGGRPAAP